MRDARAAALVAWGLIADMRHGVYGIVEKAEGPATDADLLANSTILDYLGERYPTESWGYLTEEAADSAARQDRSRLWIVDPIDGTRDFIAGRDDFAIQIAAAESTAPGGAAELVAAVVYCPALGCLYTAAKGAGAHVEVELRGDSDPHWWEGVAIEKRTPERALFAAPRPLATSGESHLSQCTAVVSRTHMTKQLRSILAALPLRHHYQRGSLGVKICEVAEARAECYLHVERGYAHQWDIAAPHLILEEAGGRVTSLDGDPIIYNAAATILPAGILATNGACHDAMLAALANYFQAQPR